MFVYPSGVNVSSSALRFLAGRLRERRRTPGTRWRRLNAGRQALLALAHLRNGQLYAQLAAGFGSGTTTAYRYIAEAVELVGRPRSPARRNRTGRVDDGIPVNTASSTRSPGRTSAAGRTRDSRAQAAPSVFPTAADGTASLPVIKPSTGPTRTSEHWSSKPSPPSSPGDSYASSAARRPESRDSSRPSSLSIWPAQLEVGKGSMCSASTAPWWPPATTQRPSSI